MSLARERGATFSGDDAVDDITLIDGGRLLRVSVEMADRPSEGVYEVKFSESQKERRGDRGRGRGVSERSGARAMDALEID